LDFCPLGSPGNFVRCSGWSVIRLQIVRIATIWFDISGKSNLQEIYFLIADTDPVPYNPELFLNL